MNGEKGMILIRRACLPVIVLGVCVLLGAGSAAAAPTVQDEMEYVIDSSPLPEPPPISLARLREGHLRLMSYNTEFSGILDSDRQPFFERIIKALDPDIMAFQELRNASQVGAIIAEWLQVPLFSVTVMGNTLVSRFPILDSTVAGSEGSQGETGDTEPAYVLTQADILGTWSGDKIGEDASGTSFVSEGTRTITFNSDGSYTSNVFTNGGADLSGTFMVLGSSVVVTSPPVGTGTTTFIFQLEDIVITNDSLKFIVDSDPVTGGFNVGFTAVFLLSRM